ATRYVISSSEDCVLKVWSVHLDNVSDNAVETKAGSELTATALLTEWYVVHAAHQGSVNAIDVSVNNQLVATASRDKTIKIWKFSKNRLDCTGVLKGHRRGVWSVYFSTREKVVLSASGDGDIKLWNLKDFSCIRTFEGHEQPVYKAVFLSNDRQILSCDQKGLVRLWDVAKPNSFTNEPNDRTNQDTDFQASRVFEAHNGRIWSLVLCPGESGFYTGGEDETLCFFKDFTEESNAENAKKIEEFVQTKQAMDNLVQEKRFSEALHLAVKLDQPKRALDLLQDLLLSDITPSTNEAGCRFPRSNSPLTNALNGLRCIRDLSVTQDDPSNSALIQRLLNYAVNWNTRARTAVVAQYVLHWVLTSVEPDELLSWPNIRRTVESLLPYTARHYQRVSNLEEQLAILDYLCDLADEHLVTDVKAPDSLLKGEELDQDIVLLDLSNSASNNMDVDS
ncbi:Transducin beta protein 3, partial [Fasciola hepatica]